MSVSWDTGDGSFGKRYIAEKKPVGKPKANADTVSPLLTSEVASPQRSPIRCTVGWLAGHFGNIAKVIAFLPGNNSDSLSELPTSQKLAAEFDVTDRTIKSDAKYAKAGDDSQRAMIGARAKGVYEAMAKERQREHGLTAPGKSKDTLCTSAKSEPVHAGERAATVMGVGARSVASANSRYVP